FPYFGWNFKVDQLDIEESRFQFENFADTVMTVNSLNVNDMDFQKMNLNLEDFNWNEEQLTATISNLSTKEKNGLELQKLSLGLEATPTKIKIDQLNLQLNNSHLENNTELQFERFDQLVSDFDNITFTTQFSKTKIASDDLKLLAVAIGELPVLDLSKNRNIILDGKLKGSLQKWRAESFRLTVGNSLLLSLSGMVENTLDVDQLGFNLQLKELSTSYEKVMAITKGLKLPIGLKEFGEVKLTGDLQGELKDITVNDLALETSANTGFDITGTIKGLPNMDQLDLNLNIEEIHTQASDLNAFAENGLPPMMDSLGVISYKGKFDGSITTFDLNGILETKLGILESDLYMDFVKDYSTAEYNGEVKLEEFQLGKLLGDSLGVGTVSLNGEIQGEGFNIDSLNAAMKVNVEHIEYQNYDYKDIRVNGLLETGVFTGALDLEDQNAAIDFDGKLSFNTEKPVYEFTLLVDTLNLEKLNLVNDRLSIQAKMDMNFSGLRVNDFQGQMSLTEIALESGDKNFETDSLLIYTDDKSKNDRKLLLRSSFLEGEIAGDYDFDQLPDLMLAYINEYFPLEDLLTRKQQRVNFKDVEKPQNFNFRFDLLDSKPVIVFVPGLDAVEAVRLSGSFNSKEKKLDINANVKELLYADFSAEEINFTSKGNDVRLRNKLSISSIEGTNGMNLPDFELRNNMLNDSMYINLDIANDTSDQVLNIAAVMNPKSEGYRLEFNEEMVANNNEWLISDGNYIDFTKEWLDINELIFSYNEQSFGLHSVGDDRKEGIPPTEIIFQNFQIKEFSKLLNLEGTSFSGELNGDLKVVDPLDKIYYTADLQVDDLALNEDPVGVLSIDLEQPRNSTVINVNASLQGNNNDLKIGGDYNIASQEYNVDADLNAVELRLIDPFVIGIFGESTGAVNGKISLRGTPQKPDLNGALNLNKVSTIIDFTKARYTINEGVVNLSNTEIDLGELTLRDANDNTAQLNGYISHDFFADLVLFLQVDTKRFQFLNTEASDNELFHGKLFLDASASVNGPVEEPLIEVRAKTLENSELNVSAFATNENFLEENYIIFGNPKTYQEDTTNQIAYEIQNALPVEVRLNLELTDEAIFRVIVDPVTGDQLECRGNSDLLINLLPSGQVDIFGTYVIQKGKYQFSYTDVVRREFEIVQGSSVAFNGDPLNARFDVTAKYATKATPYELITNESTLTDTEITAAQRRQLVEVLMKMDGDLADPQLSFDIDLPESEGSVVSSEIQRKLAELRNNKSELNKQVFGLLLLNSFIVSNASSGFGSAGESAVLGSVSKFIGKQLNKLADKYIKGVEINFDLNSYKSEYANDGDGATVTELGIGVTKEFNDRLSLKAGGNLDLNASSQSSGFSQIAGDFVLEYKLTESGNYLLKVFRRSDYDVLNEENSVRTGAGFSVKKSFGGKSKKKKRK
ncbi:MAG: translocation/assembly module TamB domain-containing protein, partial [Saprospiraceae bacterium]